MNVHHHSDFSHKELMTLLLKNGFSKFQTLRVTISKKTLGVVCNSQNVEASRLIEAEVPNCR